MHLQIHAEVCYCTVSVTDFFFALTRSPEQSSQGEGEGKGAGGAKGKGGERTRRTQVLREGAGK